MRCIVLSLVALAVAGPALASECVQVTLRDSNGVTVKTDAPLVGLALPGAAPLVNMTVPAGVAVESGVTAPCPPDLIEAVRGVFNEHCTSAKGREAAEKLTDNAAAAKDLVKQRCQAMYRVLNTVTP
ncbi:MAG: hypothetical protein SFV19_02275 [Rhodospirillaceae bacterium]|nr:hypothetical protein [Rhodospirillaceae bacterium]